MQYLTTGWLTWTADERHNFVLTLADRLRDSAERACKDAMARQLDVSNWVRQDIVYDVRQALIEGIQAKTFGFPPSIEVSFELGLQTWYPAGNTPAAMLERIQAIIDSGIAEWLSGDNPSKILRGLLA